VAAKEACTLIIRESGSGIETGNAYLSGDVNLSFGAGVGRAFQNIYN
jgi:hypothetical protein